MLLWRRLAALRGQRAPRRLRAGGPGSGSGPGPGPGKAVVGQSPCRGRDSPPLLPAPDRSFPSLLPSERTSDVRGAPRPLYMDVQATTPLVRAAPSTGRRAGSPRYWFSHPSDRLCPELPWGIEAAQAVPVTAGQSGHPPEGLELCQPTPWMGSPSVEGRSSPTPAGVGTVERSRKGIQPKY